MGWRDRRNQRLIAKYARRREAEILRNRTPLHLLDPLVAELVRIGEREHYLSSDRAREIGGLIEVRGGFAAMRAAHDQVSYWHPQHARALEMAWNGIGRWQG
jgi:hypothetical protein